MFGSGTTTLIISNEEMNDITVKIVKSLEESGLIIKGDSQTIKYEAKEQKGEFLRMLPDVLGASLLENLLRGKGTSRAGEVVIATSQGRGTIRAGQDFKLPYSLTNFEIQKYSQKEPKFNVYSKNNNNNNVTYFDSFGVEHISKEIRKFIGNKNVINVCRIQVYNSIMCGYFCIGFIDFMLKGKSLLDYANLFSLNDYEKNDKVILKYFQWLKSWKNYIVLFAGSIENLNNLRYHA